MECNGKVLFALFYTLMCSFTNGFLPVSLLFFPCDLKNIYPSTPTAGREVSSKLCMGVPTESHGALVKGGSPTAHCPTGNKGRWRERKRKGAKLLSKGWCGQINSML